jgi:beta-phosphoglucomutase
MRHRACQGRDSPARQLSRSLRLFSRRTPQSDNGLLVRHRAGPEAVAIFDAEPHPTAHSGPKHQSGALAAPCAAALKLQAGASLDTTEPVFAATLFDYNGVLIDDEHIHLAAFRDVLATLGIELSEQDYWNKYLGFDDIGAFVAVLRDSGRQPTRSEVEQLVEQKKPHYLARAKGALKPFAGARELLIERHQQGPVAIVSGALRSEIELGLEVLDVRSCILGIVAAEDTQRSKPDPEGYQLGITMLERVLSRQAARNALVIEDSVSGVQAAKLAGLCCLAVSHSYPEAELQAAGADRVVPSLGAVTTALLETLFSQYHHG